MIWWHHIKKYVHNALSIVYSIEVKYYTPVKQCMKKWHTNTNTGVMMGMGKIFKHAMIWYWLQFKNSIKHFWEARPPDPTHTPALSSSSWAWEDFVAFLWSSSLLAWYCQLYSKINISSSILLLTNPHHLIIQQCSIHCCQYKMRFEW